MSVYVCLTTSAGVQASPALVQEPSGAWEKPRRPHHASLQPVSHSPKVRGAHSVLGTRPKYDVHTHRRRRTRTHCARARQDQFRAGKRQGGRASERAGRCIGAVCSRCGARWLVPGAQCACRRSWVPTVCCWWRGGAPAEATRRSVPCLLCFVMDVARRGCVS